MIKFIPLLIAIVCACSPPSRIASDACYLVKRGEMDREQLIATVHTSLNNSGVRLDRSNPASVVFYGANKSVVGTISFGPIDFGDLIALYKTSHESRGRLLSGLIDLKSSNFTFETCDEVEGLTAPIIMEDRSVN